MTLIWYGAYESGVGPRIKYGRQEEYSNQNKLYDWRSGCCSEVGLRLGRLRVLDHDDCRVAAWLRTPRSLTHLKGAVEPRSCLLSLCCRCLDVLLFPKRFTDTPLLPNQCVRARQLVFLFTQAEPEPYSTSPTQMQFLQCPRSPVGVLILLLGITALLYQAIPAFHLSTTHITVTVASVFSKHLSHSSLCTKAVGDSTCCALHLQAEPCLDECRKAFMDRETFEPTREYDECADQCLVVYQSICEPQTAGWERSPPSEAEENMERSHRNRRRRPPLRPR
jgi:hypothetical protein